MDSTVILLVLVLIAISVLATVMITQSKKQQNILEKQLTEQLTKYEYTSIERLTRLEKNLQQDMYTFRTNFEKSLTNDFERLNSNLERRIMHVQNQVDMRLEKGFDQTTKTFQSVIERLSKIDQAQQKIDSLSTNIISLQDILNDKKARGAFGEVQLVNIFKAVFGTNDKLYKTQCVLSNNTKVDLMLFAPEPMGKVGIDSKFPLENYQRLVESHGTTNLIYEKQFKLDMKKHIDDISTKYIIEGETAEYAILFLPAEAIFAHINAYYQDVVEYAYAKKVWLTSPTTLMAMLTTLQVVLRNIERDKYAMIIREELNGLSKEFNRYQERWASLAKHIEQVSKDVREVNITTNKITTKFTQIADVQFDIAAVETEVEE